MRAAATLACTFLTACSVAASGPTATSTRSAPSLAGLGNFDRVYGSYQTDDGNLLIVTRMGWFADLRDSTYRSVYTAGTPHRFTVGSGFLVPTPVAATLDFGESGLRITRKGQTTNAHLVSEKRTDVTIPSSGATLAGTIIEPSGSGLHPGIVIVHGSETGERYYYDFWVGLYTSLGLTVLTYDKRGHGESTGRYPGGYPTD